MYMPHRSGWRSPLAALLVVTTLISTFILHRGYLTMPDLLSIDAKLLSPLREPYNIMAPAVLVGHEGDAVNRTDAAAEHANGLPGFCDVCGPTDDLCSKYGEAFLARSRAFDGAGARVRRLISKALAGQPVKIAVLGGSVTAGHAVGPHENFVELLRDWWADQFPNSELTLRNAGVPGTGTTYFSMCFQEHIDTDPDLLITEFAINDLGREEEMASYEWVLRRALQLEKRPAVINLQIFGLAYPRLATGGDYHTSVANYYDTPVISLRNPVLPAILSNPSSAPTYFATYTKGEYKGMPDYKHINARMHRALTDLLIHYLQAQICAVLRRPQQEYPVEDIPRFSLQNTFGVAAPSVPEIHPTCASVRNARTMLVPISSENWNREMTPAGLYYAAQTPGARISFRARVGVLGQIRVTFMRSAHLGLGLARCWADAEEAAAVLVDGYWRRHVSVVESFVVTTKARPGEHTVSCELSHQSNDPLKRTNFWIVGVDAA